MVTRPPPPSRPPTTLDPATLALLCGLGPILTVHACFALSASAGFVPTCVPYLDGCTSISAAGRHGWAYFLFKAGMLPSAALIVIYWRLCRAWLLAAGEVEVQSLRSLVWLGTAGALFMMLYSVFLGHAGEPYNLLRRFGVSLNLGFTYLAQLLLVWRLGRIQRQTGRALCPPVILLAKTWLLAALLVLGLGSIPVSNFIVDKDPVENAIEWVFCLLLSSFYLLTAVAWRRTGFRLAVTNQRSAPEG
jgi:hypothetical protein